MEEKKKVEDQFRLVVFSESTFEEIRSFKFRPWFLWAGLSAFAFVLLLIFMGLLLYTPLGYLIRTESHIDSEELLQLREKVLSLEQAAKAQSLYINNLRQLLSGEAIITGDSVVPDLLDDSIMPIERVEEDDALRKAYDLDRQLGAISDLRSPLVSGNKSLEQLYLIPPVTGSVSMKFDLKKDHLGVDINAPPNTPVKAVMSGYIIFAGWTLETGNTLGIQHDHNVVSFYKHNSSLLKRHGAFVEAGEAVAIIGNTGTLSTGPHLHFELWLDGKPVDPINYISFE